jgi:hypothetical protein
VCTERTRSLTTWAGPKSRGMFPCGESHELPRPSVK